MLDYDGLAVFEFIVKYSINTHLSTHYISITMPSMLSIDFHLCDAW